MCFLLLSIRPLFIDIKALFDIIVLNKKKKGPIAQLGELPAHNRAVPGSIPGGPMLKEADDVIPE